MDKFAFGRSALDLHAAISHLALCLPACLRARPLSIRTELAVRDDKSSLGRDLRLAIIIIIGMIALAVGWPAGWLTKVIS